jgi:plasmid stability protein
VATNPINRSEVEEFSDRSMEEDGRIGPNVSPKHRAILEAALAQTEHGSFFEALAAMPNVGEDRDFERNRG